MEILSFPTLVKGTFVERVNRFLAHALIENKRVNVHVHDPGRLEELLVEGAPILLLPKKGKRSDYHLIAVWRASYGWVFVHSGYHSKILEKLVQNRALPEFKGLEGYAREVRINNHRIDFALVYGERIVLAEVKGCTLFKGSLALFPDAPTKRGREHVEILARNAPSMLFFLIMTDRAEYFVPNSETDPAFTRSFLRAVESGVHVVPLTFSFDGRSLRLVSRVPFLAHKELKEAANEMLHVVSTYNERFSPESHAVLAGITDNHVYVYFSGFMCVSCGLSDYFEDLARIGAEFNVHLRPERFWQVGMGFLVAYAFK